MRVLLDRARGPLTVDGFIERIVRQCREVYDRHNRLDVEEYLKDGVFRRLEIEMVEVKVRRSAVLSESRGCAAPLPRDAFKWSTGTV